MKSLDDIIAIESAIKNDMMESDEIRMIKKIMEAKPVVTISKSKQNKLNKIIKNNRYKFWQGKNELNVARVEVGFKLIKVEVKKCLSCRSDFQSEGSHNRMCQVCRGSNGYHD